MLSNGFNAEKNCCDNFLSILPLLCAVFKKMNLKDHATKTLDSFSFMPEVFPLIRSQNLERLLSFLRFYTIIYFK